MRYFIVQNEVSPSPSFSHEVGGVYETPRTFRATFKNDAMENALHSTDNRHFLISSLGSW